MSELHLISCVHFKCGMWALNPHSLNPAKCINNYAKSIQQLIEVFSVWYGCQNVNIIQIFAWCAEWEKNPFIHYRFIPNVKIRPKYLGFPHIFFVVKKRWLCYLICGPSLLYLITCVMCEGSKQNTGLYNSWVMLCKETLWNCNF